MRYLLLFLFILAHGSSRSNVTVTSPILLGYYIGDVSYESLELASDKVTMVSMASYDINIAGNIILRGDSPDRAVSFANKKGISTYALFSNQKFDERIAHTILNDLFVQNKVIFNIIDLALREGYKGINLDFEGLSSSDRDNYSSFVTKLTFKAHQKGLKILLSVPPKTSDCKKCEWNGAFDYKTLGKVSDYIQVMTYDEHGLWDNKPGPIASYSWIDEVLEYTTSLIPSRKIIMGLPAYGYDWNLENKEKSIGIAGKIYWGSSATLDRISQSSTFKYTGKDGDLHEVWFESATGITKKSGFVNKYDLAGISVWRLGHEDPGFWEQIKI
jgi:spore germination protein YaaH